MLLTPEQALAIALAVGISVALPLQELRKIRLKVFIYAILLLLVGIIGVMSRVALLFKIFSALVIISAIIIIIGDFVPALGTLAVILFVISPLAFPIILGGLLAVGDPHWILVLILGFIALVTLKSFYEKLIEMARRASAIY